MRVPRNQLVSVWIAAVALSLIVAGCGDPEPQVDPMLDDREHALAETQAELERREEQIALLEKEQKIDRMEAEIALQKKQQELDRREVELARQKRVPAPAAPPRPVPTAAPVAAQPAPPPPEPTPSKYVTIRVPAGTDFDVEMVDGLSSGTNIVGDRFRGRLVEDLVIDGEMVSTAGSEITGRVTEVVPLKKFGGKPRLAVAFDGLEVASGEMVVVSATLVEEGRNQTAKDAAAIGGGTAAGAVIGHQIDHDNGKIIGAVVGGAIGTAVAANTGNEIEVPAGSTLRVQLESPVEVWLRSSS